MMDLRPKPSHYVRQKTHPYWYKCRMPGCWGSIWAHKNGQPMGIPAPRESRLLRREIHRLLDRLWNKGRHSLKLRLRNRAIVYLYMAHSLGLDPDSAHLGRITDANILRRYLALITNLDRPTIFAWWKGEGCKIYQIEQGIKMPIDQGIGYRYIGPDDVRPPNDGQPQKQHAPSAC